MYKNIKPQHLPAVVFIGFLSVMLVLMIFLPKSEYSPLEKRYLAKPPKTDADAILSGKFAEQTEDYLTDHAPGRNFFVGVQAYTKLLMGQNGSNGVYLCDDGYLISKPVQDGDIFKKNISIIKKFAENTDANISVMLAPQCGYILEDKLPAIHEEYNDNIMLNEAQNALESSCSFIRLDDVFKKNSAAKQLYYKTDHHWTSEGAYLAYCRFCEEVGISAAERSDYSITEYGGFYGTTYARSGYWGVSPDVIETWQSQSTAASISVEITENNSTAVSSDMFFTEHCKDDDKYNIFLDGNHSMVRIKNSACTNGKLLIVKDSYAHTLAPFLADNYSEIIMVDLRFYKLPVSKIISEEKVDDVLIMYSLANFAQDTDIPWLCKTN